MLRLSSSLFPAATKSVASATPVNLMRLVAVREPEPNHPLSGTAVFRTTRSMYVETVSSYTAMKASPTDKAPAAASCREPPYSNAVSQSTRASYTGSQIDYDNAVLGSCVTKVRCTSNREETTVSCIGVSTGQIDDISTSIKDGELHIYKVVTAVQSVTTTLLAV